MLAEPPAAHTAALAAALDLGPIPSAADYAACFTFARYPYASVYLDPSGMLGGTALDRIAGFYRALEIEVPKEADHLAALLALWAGLAEREGTEEDPGARALLARAQRTLVLEHLACWLPPYLDTFDERVAPAYRAWATVLRELLAATLAACARERALEDEPVPAHLRDAPPLEDPRAAGADAFLDGLLAPVRAGFVLVRDDLVAIARAIGTGARAGERRFVLRALLAHDAGATLEHLAAHADSAAARTAAWHAAPPVAAFWAGRATASAALLHELAPEAVAP